MLVQGNSSNRGKSEREISIQERVLLECVRSEDEASEAPDAAHRVSDSDALERRAVPRRRAHASVESEVARRVRPQQLLAALRTPLWHL